MKLVFERNNLLDGYYVEPYAGGSGIAMTLLVHSYASRVYLNDIDACVYAFWCALVDHPDELCRAIRNAKVTMREWRKQRAIITDPTNHTPLEVGFATFFLNRTNRSGIIWGGVVGGKDQEGPWKLDARFQRKDLIKRVEKIALYRSRIRLSNLDAVAFIKDVVPALPARTLVYLDPPYYVKGGDLYENSYRHKDHEAIASLVKRQITLPWILSYDNVPQIRKMYAGCPSIKYGISYSAQDRYRGREVMFFSKRIVIPDVKNPARTRAA